MRAEVVIAATGLGALAMAITGGHVASDGEAPAQRHRRGSRHPAGLWWEALLADVGIEGDPHRWARTASGFAVLAIAFGAMRGGWAGASLLAAISASGAVVVRRLLSGRGARRADARLPALVEHTGRALRSGLDLPRALSVAAERTPGVHGGAAAEVVRRVDGGVPLVEALDGWVRSEPRPPVALVVSAFTVAAEAGGRPAVALDGVAATLRARAAVVDEARSLASQARASAAVLVALPLVVAFGGVIGGSGDALVTTGWGRACLVGALGLDMAGAWWMHRIAGAGTQGSW